MSETKLSQEIQAMATIEEALTSLDEDARRRVLRWAGERYKVSMSGSRDGGDMEETDDGGPSGSGSSGVNRGTGRAGGSPTDDYETFADFYSACSPPTDADRVLVATYWATAIEGEPEVESRPLNAALRDLGHGVGHMPSAFETLVARRPQPVVQTRKTGKSKQATRRFKLTAEGRRAVERMLASGQSGT